MTIVNRMSTRKLVSEGNLLYHVTALNNLQSILEHGLLSRNDAIASRLLVKDVANSEIIEKRKELGILDCVPFHFFEPTPFTGAIFKAHPNTAFCTITVARKIARNNGWRICPLHPLSLSSRDMILDYDTGIQAMKWDIINSRDYHNQECKVACMAECLAPSPVPPSMFLSIFVANDIIKLQVEQMANKTIAHRSFYIDINPVFSQG